jgi:hypothetical protein
MALFGVTDELAEAILVLWLDKANVSFCNCRSILSCDGMVIPDFAIVIVAPQFQVRESALASDMAAADHLSVALDCTIINSSKGNPSSICSSRWSNRLLSWQRQEEWWRVSSNYHMEALMARENSDGLTVESSLGSLLVAVELTRLLSSAKLLGCRLGIHADVIEL